MSVMDLFRLDGKVVIVTGASSGLGVAFAHCFAEAGADVVLGARRVDRLPETGKLVEAAGRRYAHLQTDVTVPDQCTALVQKAVDEFGRVDVLVNNAGLARIRALEECSDEDVLVQVGANLLGAVWCTRAALPLLRRSSGADIVNIGSESYQEPFPLLSLYAAAKGGLAVFSNAMLRELRPAGIRVTLCVAGRTKTEFGTDWTPEESARGYQVWGEQGYLTRVSGEGHVDPDDFAQSVLYVVTRPREMMIDVMHVRAQK
jgi:NAD(P)-dependent dehydrogenase (short-subunit alcohol dehydrogenase family)